MITTEFVMQFKGVDKLKKFIDKDVYETFLQNILLKFPGISKDLEKIIDQSHSEGDFKDPISGINYEATLLVNDNMFYKIIKDPSYLASDELSTNRQNDVLSIFIESLERKKNKCITIILFNILPDTFSKFQDAITEVIFKDDTDQILDKLIEEYLPLINGKEIILVSYNDDDSFYIRTLYPRKDDLYFVNEYENEVFPFKITRKKVIITDGKFT